MKSAFHFLRKNCIPFTHNGWKFYLLWIQVFNFFLAGPIFSSYSQGAEEYLIIPEVRNIIFDGMPDEPDWDAIEPLPVVQYEPDAGSPPTQITEFRFAHDENYFYGSMRGYDTDLHGIRGNSLYRDRLAGSDHFEIMLDTYNDNETGYIFSTTPTAIRNDAAITNDGTGGTISQSGWFNHDFNTFWDAKAKVTEEGWFTEVRIPFSSLRFQEINGEVIMGLTVQRKIARRSERIVYPAIPPITDWAFLRPSLAQKIKIQGIRSRKQFYVTPYALTGVTQWNKLNEGENGYDRENEFKWEAGGDMKISLTNYLTLDLTVNTDFAQAEADDQQVNLTRFSLFYPEKRQFFQERAGIFDFKTGGLSRLFYSRRIGLTDEGDLVPIYGGARAVGRVGTWDLGFLDMQTAPVDSLPSENFGLLRMRRRVFNDYSYVGGLFTSRLGSNGDYNVAYGLDGLVRLFGDDYLIVKYAQTFDNMPLGHENIQGFNSARIVTEWQRRRRQGVGYDFGFIWSGINYDPGMGFVQRNDFKYITEDISYTWLYENNNTRFIWQKVGFSGFAYVLNQDNSVQSAEFGPEWSFSTRTTSAGSILVKGSYESLKEDFYLSDSVYVPMGDYSFYRLSASYRTPLEKLFNFRATIEAGTFYDGTRYSFLFSPAWYVSKHLELSAEYLYERVRFNERSQKFDAHITRLRIGTAINNKISTNAFIQFNSTLDLVSANIRFRYNFREGNDLWIVYNEGLNTEPYRYTPELPVSDSRTLLIKYTHTFHL
jgi:hypothetical protein